MKQEIVKKEEAQAPALASGDWGVGTEVDTADLLIPKILLIQKMSKMVDQGATAGEFRDSLDQTLLGKGEVEVIIFSTFSTLQIHENKQWVSTEPYTPANALLPWAEDIDGKKVERVRCYNFYCLTASGNSSLPYCFSLSKTSAKTAKRLLTVFAKMQAGGKVSASKVFKLKAIKSENDKGSWFAVDFEVGRDTTQAELERAHTWFNSIKKGGAKVHDTDEVESPIVATADEDIPF